VYPRRNSAVHPYPVKRKGLQGTELAHHSVRAVHLHADVVHQRRLRQPQRAVRCALRGEPPRSPTVEFWQRVRLPPDVFGVQGVELTDELVVLTPARNVRERVLQTEVTLAHGK
jgi:hypothetical protein